MRPPQVAGSFRGSSTIRRSGALSSRRSVLAVSGVSHTDPMVISSPMSTYTATGSQESKRSSRAIEMIGARAPPSTPAIW